MRSRFSAAGGKSDSFGAFLLAELARTDNHRYWVLAPGRGTTKALRALTRVREELVQTRVALANELRAQLGCFWPGAAGVFADIDSPIALAFLKRYSSPADARGMREQRMARFLARHGYCGPRTPRELLQRLRGAAEGRSAEVETKNRRQIVLATPPCNACSRARRAPPDRPRLPSPTSSLPSDGPAQPSPQAARRTEHEALDGKRSVATTPAPNKNLGRPVDTGSLMPPRQPRSTLPRGRRAAEALAERTASVLLAQYRLAVSERCQQKRSCRHREQASSDTS